MHPFLSALAGGALIGLSASLLLLFNGRVAGISGIAGGLLSSSRAEWGWRASFVGGLVAGGLLLSLVAPQVFGVSTRPAQGTLLLLGSGLLVGLGTRLGSGCTSGHGICGLSRGSRRSLAATLTFMATGILTASLLGHFTGALP